VPIRFIDAYSYTDLFAQLRGAPPAPLPEGRTRWIRVGVILEDEEGVAELRTAWREIASALDDAIAMDEALEEQQAQRVRRRGPKQRQLAARWGVAPSKRFVNE
jgi:hypothetical protein